MSSKSDKISVAADEPQPTTAEAPTTIMSRDRETPQAYPPQVIKEVVREVGTPGLGDEDLANAISPLQKQMTAAQKLHGALLDRIEALEGKANDHDDRLVKVENKTKSHDGLHKQGKYKIKLITLVFIFVARSDIDEILDRLGKLENSNNMASALADANLGDNSVDLILKAIEDMQNKINAETDKKLSNYVKKPDFSDLESLVQSSNRRLHHQE